MEHFHHSIKSSHTWEAIFKTEKQQRLVTLECTQTLNFFVIFNLYYLTNTFSFLPLILKFRVLSYAQIIESHEEQEPDLPTSSFSHQEASISLLSLSIKGLADWKPQL